MITFASTCLLHMIKNEFEKAWGYMYSQVNSDDMWHFGGRSGSTERVKILLVGEGGTIIDLRNRK